MKKIWIYFVTSMVLLCFVGCTKQPVQNDNANLNNDYTSSQTTSSTTSDVGANQNIATTTTTTAKKHETTIVTTTRKPTTTTTRKPTTTTTKKPTTTTKAHTHTFSSWIIVKEASCTAEGLKKRTCSSCGAVEQQNIARASHNMSFGKCKICGLSDPNIQYSRLSGEFTYFYNNYVGTRGDNGAKVMLIPKNPDVKKYDNKMAMAFITGIHDSGIIVEKCDGYGRFDTGIEYVPAGEYIVIVVSSNTRGSSAMTKEQLSSRLGAYLSDENLDTLALFIGFNKCAIDTIQLKAGYEHTISHDFGTTYF